MEEWSTFNVERPEEDDESVLDHFLTRTPREWRDEWEHAPNVVRTSQGCLTSGQWFIDTDLKLRAMMGQRAWLGLLVRQSENDYESFNYLDFQFNFPTAWGTLGAAYRPFHDKSRQDLTLTYELGADTLTQHLQVAFAFEDVFNNFWAFRQTRVGDLAEPYEKRPYEPGLRWTLRQPGLRIDVGGRYLTPSEKRVIDYSQPITDRLVTIWGTIANASIEAHALGFEWEATTENKQARSTDAPADGSMADNADFERRWSVEGVLRRWLRDDLVAEMRYVYQDRDANRGPPMGPSTFGGIDRMTEGELRWRFHPRFVARAGGMYDKISIAQAGPYHVPSYGSRKESRAFVSLQARFGNITVAGVEGIELDNEPYRNSFYFHDKGFLQLQATF